jgi:hypothetical protein
MKTWTKSKWIPDISLFRDAWNQRMRDDFFSGSGRQNFKEVVIKIHYTPHLFLPFVCKITATITEGVKE